MSRPKGLPKTGGRQKGTPNKSSAAMKAAIESVYQQLQEGHEGENGHFLRWARGEPTEFYKLASKLLPIQVTGEGGGAVTHRIELVSAPALEPKPVIVDIVG